MLNIRNHKIKLITELKENREHSIKTVPLKPGLKPSIVSDDMFKTMFQNETRIKYGAKLISYFVDYEYEKLLKVIKFDKNEHNKENNELKGLRSDYIVDINGTKINIEVNNNNNKEILERNLEYVFRMYYYKNKKGKKDNTYNQVIQLNLNNFSYKGIDKTISINTIQDENQVTLTNKIIIIHIYLPNILVKWYNKKELMEWEKFIISIIEQDNSKIKEFTKEIEIVKEYVEDISNQIVNTGWGESYDHLQAEKDQFYLDGLADGRKEAKEEVKRATENIIRNMSNMNIPIEQISSATNISVSKIEEILNK